MKKLVALALLSLGFVSTSIAMGVEGKDPAAVPAGLGTLLRVPRAGHSAILVDEDVGVRVAEFLHARFMRVLESA